MESDYFKYGAFAVFHFPKWLKIKEKKVGLILANRKHRILFLRVWKPFFL
jgi:hypothetical protein